LDPCNSLSQLLQELQDRVIAQAEGFPLDLKEVKQLQLELMEEHTAYVDIQMREFSTEEFNFVSIDSKWNYCQLQSQLSTSLISMYYQIQR